MRFRGYTLFFPLLLMAALITAPAQANPTESVSPELKQQRLLFQEAEKALKKGRLSRFHQYEKQLHDYPLHIYLDYTRLKRRLATASSGEVLNFLQKSADSPLSERLHAKWMKQLARQGKWALLVENYKPTSSTTMRCQYARGLYQLGQADKAHALMDNIWLTGKSLPKACDAPLKQWQKAGRLSDEKRWLRIRLAMNKGRTRLARHIAKALPPAQRHWVESWIKVRRDQGYIREVFAHSSKPYPEVLGQISVYALRRMAGRKPLQAAELWQQLKTEFDFSVDQKERIERRLALALLNSQDPEARLWLTNLKLEQNEERVISLHFFSAMQDQDWDTALGWLQRLSDNDQHTDRWRYWRGRVLEAIGRLEEARSVYLLSGEERGYYSFLAADRAGQRYQFSNVPISYKPTELSDVDSLPAIQRARELIAIKRTVDARREWNFAIPRLSHSQQLKAAKLADQWGWHDRAIATLAAARYWDDLTVRFPLAHQQQVVRQATKTKINPAWAFAIIRQESAFTPDARSHAGALGLMQLMPRTARKMARTLHLRRPRRHDILNIDTNIRLGVQYLKTVQDRYQGHPVLATAAYNAGHRRVIKWLPEKGSVAADIWIEKVPFNETRDYLKRILTYTVIYEQRLGRQPVPLLERMTPISRPPEKRKKTARAGDKAKHS